MEGFDHNSPTFLLSTFFCAEKYSVFSGFGGNIFGPVHAQRLSNGVQLRAFEKGMSLDPYCHGQNSKHGVFPYKEGIWLIYVDI